MFTPTLRCECAQPASDRLMRKWLEVLASVMTACRVLRSRLIYF